jgi:hypothetical protein
MPSPDTINLLGTIGVFLLLLFSLKNPFYGLLSYLGTMIMRIGLIYPELGEMRIELLVGLLVLAEIFVKRGNSFAKLRLGYNPVNRFMLLFFVVIMLSFVQAWDYTFSWNDVVFEFIKIYLFFIMILTLVESEGDLKRFFWAFSLLTILIDYEGIYSYFTGSSTYVFQGIDVAVASQGFASGHVAAANMQLQCLPIMIYLMLGTRKVAFKVLAGFMAILSLVGVIASGSRGGFLGLIVLGALIVYFSKRKVLTLILCSVTVIALGGLFSSSYLAWMSSITDYSGEVSANSRISGLENGIEMLIKRPIFGVGPGCYALARKAYFGWGLDAHNHFGQLMGELGIIGSLVWGFFIFHVLKNVKRAKKSLREAGNIDLTYLVCGIQVALIVRLFEGMFSHSLYIFFWYMMAALSIVIVKSIEINKGSNDKRDTEILSPKG